MFKKFFSVLIASIFLSGCAGKAVNLNHFGGKENVDKAFMNADQPILIGEFGNSRPNSAGGVDVSIELINTSPKTIKYISFWVTPYNRNGDETFDSIDRQSTKPIRYNGPLSPGFTNTVKGFASPPKTLSTWKNVWYNHNIECIKIDKLEIEYNDSSKLLVANPLNLFTREGECRLYWDYMRSNANL